MLDDPFRLVVSQNQRALHIVFPHQFLDSPEWFGVSTDDYFQVRSLVTIIKRAVLIVAPFAGVHYGDGGV